VIALNKYEEKFLCAAEKVADYSFAVEEKYREYSDWIFGAIFIAAATSLLFIPSGQTKDALFAAIITLELDWALFDFRISKLIRRKIWFFYLRNEIKIFIAVTALILGYWIGTGQLLGHQLIREVMLP
jgi:hypothetical protein